MNNIAHIIMILFDELTNYKIVKIILLNIIIKINVSNFNLHIIFLSYILIYRQEKRQTKLLKV